MPRRKKTTKPSAFETAKRSVVDLLAPGERVAQAYCVGKTKLLGMLGRRLPVPDDREDALHDVIVKVLVRDMIDPIDDVNAYLYVSVENIAKDRYRAPRLVESADHSELEKLLKLRAQHLRSVEENCMSNDILGKILEQLPPEQREAVRLVRLEGHTHQEAAAAMNISERRIETLLAKAKALAVELSSLDPISGGRK